MGKPPFLVYTAAMERAFPDPPELFVDRIASPVGTITLVTDELAVRALDFRDYDERMERLLRAHYGARTLTERRETLGVRDRLARYFDGDLDAFEGLALATNGTEFQRRAWAFLLTIPPGTTTTYGAQAAALGMTGNGSRAVGLANGSNPIAIIIPCHRVIGANGRLTGYGGGLPRKAWLLEHEARAEPAALSLFAQR